MDRTALSLPSKLEFVPRDTLRLRLDEWLAQKLRIYRTNGKGRRIVVPPRPPTGPRRCRGGGRFPTALLRGGTPKLCIFLLPIIGHDGVLL